MLNLTYKSITYTLRSEAALIALICWLQVQEADAKVAA